MEFHDNPREIENLIKKISALRGEELEKAVKEFEETLQKTHPDQVDLMLDVGLKMAESKLKRMKKTLLEIKK